MFHKVSIPYSIGNVLVNMTLDMVKCQRGLGEFCASILSGAIIEDEKQFLMNSTIRKMSCDAHKPGERETQTR